MLGPLITHRCTEPPIWLVIELKISLDTLINNYKWLYYFRKIKSSSWFPKNHPHQEKETLLNPSHIRAAGHYVSDSEIENGGLQPIVSNYNSESKKDHLIILLSYLLTLEVIIDWTLKYLPLKKFKVGLIQL